jgi:hypothetical protein
MTINLINRDGTVAAATEQQQIDIRTGIGAETAGAATAAIDVHNADASAHPAIQAIIPTVTDDLPEGPSPVNRWFDELLVLNTPMPAQEFPQSTDPVVQGTYVGAGIFQLQGQIDDLDAAKSSLAVANTFTKSQTSQMVTRGTVTGTVTIDASAGNSQRMVLGGNITLAAPSNPMSGQNLGLHIIQDGTGSRIITWNAVFKWAGGTAPSLSTTASARDFVAMTYDDVSAVWICSLSVKGAA